jgi:hypothetical protein
VPLLHFLPQPPSINTPLFHCVHLPTATANLDCIKSHCPAGACPTTTCIHDEPQPLLYANPFTCAWEQLL